jgi:hypothetical protein
VVRLLIAIAVGLVIAAGASVLAQNVLTSQVNGTPSNQSPYAYGTR